MTTKRLFDRPRAEAAMRDFLLALGEDLADPNVAGTPERVTRMYCEELLSGHTDKPNLRSFDTPGVGNQFVVTSSLDVRSLCSHHLMPVTGVAHIGAYFYAQDGSTQLPGLSKYQRIVNMYARRLQLQERLTKEIADEVISSLGADWVIVYVKAQHHCMIHRGVMAVNSNTATTAISVNPHLEGDHSEQFARLRGEFFQEVGLAR